MEEEFGTSDLAHGGTFASILHFGQEQWSGGAVFVGDQVAGMFSAQTEVSSSPESRDDGDMFELVASQPSGILFAFHCTVL